MADGSWALTDVDDIDECFSKKDFLDYVGTKLHMSVNSSYKKFCVFWDEADDESDSYLTLFSNVGTSLLTPPIIKDKAKIALQHVDLSFKLSLLAQFWVPVTIGGRRLLTASGQPFGLTCLLKGLCSYRKHCLNCLYYSTAAADVEIIGEERETVESVVYTGPPTRVFLNGLPEYSPNVEFYSDKEYPLRKEATKRKIKSYMAVPVFEPTTQECVAVLELVSSDGVIGAEMDKPAYIFGLISTALQVEGLRTSNFTFHLNMEKELAESSTGSSHALRDICKALHQACRRHNLPFAQTWASRSVEIQSYIGTVLSPTSDECYLSNTRFSLFRDTCESFQLLRGRGVVWTAFSSGNSCFCRDIAMLSISEYSFAHVARKVLLHSSFAICLKSDHTGDDIYVLELFLPFKTADPRQLLESVLRTMIQYLNSFRFASGQKLGDEMHVEVLSVSKDDESDCLRLFPTSGSVGLQDQSFSTHQQVLSVGWLGWGFDTVDDPLSLKYLPEGDASVSKSSLAFDNDLQGRKEDSSDTPSAKDGSPYINSSASTSILPDKDHSGKLLAEDPWHTVLGDLKVDSSDTQEGRSSASEFERITPESVQKLFGMKLADAARFLKVSPSTLKRKCRKLGFPCWPRKKSRGNCSSTSIKSDLNNEKDKPECSQQGLNSGMSTEEGTTSSKQNFSQDATVTGNNLLTIKAAYGKKIIIKFQLPFSSRLGDMENEIASMLKLRVGDFNIRYKDEDEDWILLTRDADLRTMESMGKTTIRVLITDGTNAATSE